jgi:magnesium transporter
MNQDVVSCLTSTDLRKKSARCSAATTSTPWPVLNDDRRLVGIITIDDAVDVMTAEATEDIEKLGALTPAETNDGYLKTSPEKMAWRCIPWLIILLVMGTLSSLVLSRFDEKIAAVPLLASFLPVLMDGGGNSGGQTTTLMVRGLALKEFGPKQFGKVLWKEFRTACLVGLIVGVFGLFWFVMEQYLGIVAVQIPVNGVKTTENVFLGNCWNFEFFNFTIITAAVTGSALALTIVVAKVIAVCLPLGVAALKKDPALMSEPLLTTVADVAALLIYFGLAEAFIIPFMERL